MPAVANLVHQSSTSTGTGNFTLEAVNGKQSFAQAFGVGGTPNTFDYFISSQDAPQWERGTGHMSSALTLVRDTVLEGTNGTNRVNFADGVKDIINDIPAGKQVNRDGLAQVAFSGDYDDLSNRPSFDNTVPAIAADTMLVDDPTGTQRQTKTFPEVRALLQVPSFSDLPWVVATENGVPGDGTDQTTALQAIINGLPAEGGNILLAGDVRWTQLTAADRRNIRFIGLGGYGAGAQQRTLFRCVAGALGNGVSAFNLKRTMNVSFEKMFVDSRDAAFTGTLLDWGDLTSGSALMSMIDCYLNVLSNVSGARGINLYGTTQGVFERVKFAGARTLIQMQNAVGVGFCNQHAFRSCSFNPTGTQYPVAGSGEGITFENCNVQASSGDGIGRFWSTDLTQPFRGVNLIGNTFYDVLTAGGIWANFYTGRGLNIIGNMVGGAADVTLANNYGFQLGGGTAGVNGTPLGVAGGCIIGNEFRYMTAGVGFGGTSGTYNNVRSMTIGSNTCFGSLTPSGSTSLYSSASSAENITWLPSEQGATPVNPSLSLVSGLTPAANKLPYFSGTASAALADFTSLGRSVLASSSAAAAAAALGIREVLTANRVYYVDKTLGSNSNDGLAAGSGRAFQTIQKAIDTACALDLSIYKVTINIADATGYAGFVLKNYVGVGPIEIIGNTTTPANVDLSGSSTNISGNGWSTSYVVKGMKLANSAGNCMGLVGPGSLTFNNINFGATTGAHIRADNSVFVTCTSGVLTISGNAGYGWLSGYLSLINLDSSTITYTANVAYGTAHCYAQLEGMINVPNVTWTLGGFTVTGTRYNAYANATINTNGGGASFIPGSVAGTTTGDGVYN